MKDKYILEKIQFGGNMKVRQQVLNSSWNTIQNNIFIFIHLRIIFNL